MTEALKPQSFSDQLDFIATHMIASYNTPKILNKDLRDSLIVYNDFSPADSWFNMTPLSVVAETNRINNEVLAAVGAGVIDAVIKLPFPIHEKQDGTYEYLTNFNAENQIVESLNFSHILEVLPSSEKHGFGDASTTSALLDLMDCLQVTIHTLHEPNLKKLKANIPFSVRLYRMKIDGRNATTNNYLMKHEMTDDARKYVSKIIPNIDKLDETSSNIEVIKRVLRGYILLIHVHIVLAGFNILEETAALFSNSALTESTGISSASINIDTLLNDMFQTTVGMLVKENDRFLYQNVSNKTRYDELSFIDQHNKSRELHKKISEYESQYDNGITVVGEQEQVIENEESGVSFQQGNVKQNQKTLRREATIHNVFLAIFIILIVALFGILGTNERAADAVEQFQLKTVVGVIFLFCVASFIIIYVINNKVFESFATDATNVAITLDAFERYLENTITLGLLVDTNMRYGDIVHRLKNEIDENHNEGVRLKLNKESLKDNQTYDHRKSKILKERVLLFLQLLIILSAVVFVHLNTKELDVFLSIVLIVLSLIVVYLYIIKAGSFVNTDPTKIYWKKPPTSMLS